MVTMIGLSADRKEILGKMTKGKGGWFGNIKGKTVSAPNRLLAHYVLRDNGAAVVCSVSEDITAIGVCIF